MTVSSEALEGDRSASALPRWAWPGRRRFEATRPSLIAGLRRNDRQVAFPALCGAYSAPLAAAIRARTGCQPADADDAVQGFLVSAMRPGFFATFDPRIGKFRHWLGKAAYRFFLRRHPRRPEEVGLDPTCVVPAVDPRRGDDIVETDRALDRAWIEAVCERARERLRRRYAAADQTELFWDVYEAVMGERRMTDDAARARLLGRSPGSLKQAKHKEKSAWTLAYHGCLREELATLGVKRADMTGILREMLDVYR